MVIHKAQDTIFSESESIRHISELFTDLRRSYDVSQEWHRADIIKHEQRARLLFLYPSCQNRKIETVIDVAV